MARRTRQGQPGGWSDEELRSAVASSRSYAEALRRLGRQPGGSVYVKLKRDIERLGLDTGHMTHRGWLRGRTNPHVKVRPLEEILVRDSTYTSTYNLKLRLWNAGLLPRACMECGISSWNGAPAPLQLDHVNGDRRDHRMENLRILCANCHAQTATWCGRNIGRYDGG